MDAVHVDQSPGDIDSVVETHDIAVVLMGAIGSYVASIGERRGLGRQTGKIDRRHAGLLFNEIAYFFQSGWQFDISAVFTPINGFHRTRDGREIVFNGAPPIELIKFADAPPVAFEPGRVPALAAASRSRFRGAGNRQAARRTWRGRHPLPQSVSRPHTWFRHRHVISQEFAA
jgi:hypothetical protein